MNFKNRRSQLGFNMIEVLISIVVVAIGLLGIVALQVASARFNSSSYYRNVATTLAMDQAERMRSYLSDSASDSYPMMQNPAATAACITATGCAKNQMSQSELNSWMQDVSRLLPNGQARICRDNNVADDEVSPVATFVSPKCTENPPVAGTPSYTSWAIKIWWSEDRDGTLKRFTMVY